VATKKLQEAAPGKPANGGLHVTTHTTAIINTVISK
jgi:hypothetical protein